MKKLLLLIIVILLLYIFRADILTAYARQFTVNTASDGADMMLIMSGNIETRPAYAAKLYHQGYAKRVFLTQEKNWLGHLSPHVEARNIYARHFLLEEGVPVEILPSKYPEGTMSSLDEVYDAVDFVRQHDEILHLIVVTDTPHSYRTLYLFNKVFKANGLGHVRLEIAAAPNELFDESNWFTTEKGIEFYIEESYKTLYYWLGLNQANLLVPH